MAKKVQLVEVGLRDGLQNERVILDQETRVSLALQLSLAGAQRIEIGAFVRPDWVPQMSGSKQIIEMCLALKKSKQFKKGVQFSALVPNEKGMQEALSSGISEVAIFASCTESFSRKNLNCSIEESFERFKPVMALAKKHKIKVRGYLSVCFGCPFEGKVPEKKVIELTQRLFKLGVYEVSLGDTIGVATPYQVQSLLKKLQKKISLKKVAGHFHDTRGTALVNILKSFELGVRVFDTSIGGLGGCPYAPGSAGNVSTEDVVYLFHGLGVETGFDLPKLVTLNKWLSHKMNKDLSSKVGKVGPLKPTGPV
jgi:hydroxymethylglutaryl-CoA lyase